MPAAGKSCEIRAGPGLVGSKAGAATLAIPHMKLPQFCVLRHARLPRARTSVSFGKGSTCSNGCRCQFWLEAALSDNREMDRVPSRSVRRDGDPDCSVSILDEKPVIPSNGEVVRQLVCRCSRMERQVLPCRSVATLLLSGSMAKFRAAVACSRKVPCGLVRWERKERGSVREMTSVPLGRVVVQAPGLRDIE